MVYHIHPTPRFSSPGPSRRNSAETPRTSSEMPSGIATPRSGAVRNNSSTSAIKRAINGMTEEYWSNPSPLYTPRGSVDATRPSTAAPKEAAPVGTTANPHVVETKKEKKGFFSKVKKFADRNAQEYWGNAEMNAMYGNALSLKV